MKKLSMLLSVILLFTVFQSTETIATTTPPYSSIILASGMISAMGICIGPDDKIYIADFSNGIIWEMNKDGSNFKIFTTDVTQPVDIAFDNDGNLIVAEYSGRKVVKIDSSGNGTVIKDTSVFLTGLAVDSQNNIFVVDHFDGKIYKMENDGSNFETFATITYNEFAVTNSLIGLSIDANDNLYVSDGQHSRIIKIDPSGNQSDFVNINSPRWVSVGKDGYIYGSSSDRTIQKFDPSGDIVATYSTDNHFPWGTQIDTDGSIYYVYNGSTVNKILGYAETIDRRHVKINLLYDLVNGPLDPSAFTLTGVNSSPQVTDAVFNNSEIILTLNNNIEHTDTNVKVNYNKTGTHNIIQQGTSKEISDFANLSVANNVIGITSVETLSSINVDHGTPLNNISLPTTVTVNLSNSTTTSAAITWDGGTPVYDPDTAGTYSFSGTLSLPSDVFNPENIKATVDVIVSEVSIPTVTTIGAISDITVPYGTELSNVELPTTVSIGLNNSTTTSAAITWDGGTPVYDPDTAGTYSFSGTLSLPSDINNPANIKATVDVIVSEVSISTVTTIGAISDITVPYGTELSNVELPTTVSIGLSNSTTTSAAITWDGGTPVYDPDTAGTYSFSGTLSLPSDINNPANIKATVDVIVSEVSIPTVTTIGAISDITVPYGTELSNVELPTTVSIGLSNSTTTSAAITWDGGTPVYDPDTAGTYSFSGTIAPSYDFVNSNNLRASAQVIVENARHSNNNSSRKNSVDEINDRSIVVVNGVEKNVATETKTFENGKSKIELSIDNTVISKLIEDSSTSQSSLPNAMDINIHDTSADLTVLDLNGETVKQLTQNNFYILINLGHTKYKIPAKELDLDNVANKLNVNNETLKNIQFFIELNTFTDEEESDITNKVRNNNGKILVRPTEFVISAVASKNKDKTETIQITNFKQYVSRIFEIPNNVNPEDITTGIVFDQNYNYTQVPTRIYTENGKKYAEINSLTNSIYSVINHPITVDSVKGHWSESTVNDLASRLIVKDYDTFEPDKNITRGDFSTYMVQALGLYTYHADFNNTFPDVKASNENAIGISLARQWGLINGYEDGMFKPNNAITREEAMVIFAKAMALADYEGIAGTSQFKIESDQTIPNWSKPSIQKVLDGQLFIGRSKDDLGLKQNITHAETLTALRNLLIKAELINDTFNDK